ncbi:MAG: hypothetical protein K2X72_06240 [Reyranella sp.]|nr:hypothetical protein [Reyranella sp.]
MTRSVDLTTALPEAFAGSKLPEIFETAFGRRPIRKAAQWVLEEPSAGFSVAPLLQVSGPMPIETERYNEVAVRVASFVSRELRATAEDRPKSIQIAGGFGLITELEEMQLRAFLAHDDEELVRILVRDVFPFVVDKFQVTHVCVVRPNLKPQQERLSLAKLLWARDTFGESDFGKRVLEDRVLDAVFPLPNEMANWLHVFLASAPVQVTITFQLLGAYVLFIHKGVYRFPHAPLAGILGRFATSPVFETTSGGMKTGLWLRVGTIGNIHDYLKCATSLVSSAALFASNPINFQQAGKWDSQKQVQYLAALNLFFWDVLSANQAHSLYERVSFCLSALDKLANIVRALAQKSVSETAVFKSCFSTRTALGLRDMARRATSKGDDVVGTMLRVQARHILTVQKSIRDQAHSATTEPDRLAWLRSYRNLRHGTFLDKNQFESLFVSARGLAPSDLTRVVMAMTIALALDPPALFDLLSA